jgi:hypothetical protein
MFRSISFSSFLHTRLRPDFLAKVSDSDLYPPRTSLAHGQVVAQPDQSSGNRFMQNAPRNPSSTTIKNQITHLVNPYQATMPENLAYDTKGCPKKYAPLDASGLLMGISPGQ